jgi:multiple sugar transport system ATP-binding protein
MTLGSRIAVMKDGVLQQIGTPDEIYNRPANTYVASFIGSPTMNLVHGHVAVAGAQGQFSFASTALPCPCPAQGAAVLGIRP